MSQHGSLGSPQIERQMVNFQFYRLDPAFRRLDAKLKAEAGEEFLAAVLDKPAGMHCLSYSTAGLRAETDLMLWRIAPSTDHFQAQTRAINKTRLAGYLSSPHAFLAMTKRSMYIDKIDPQHVEDRMHIVPGKRKYLFVYPFVKTRDWYLIPHEARQSIMDVHIEVGNKFPSVKLNTTYSFGMDDQEFVVAFETDEPKDFVDLVMSLRETQSSKYTLRDTPIFTCVQMPMAEVLDQLF